MLKSYNGFTPEQREQGDRIIKEAIAKGELKPLKDCVCADCGQDKGIRHYHTEDYSPDKILKAVVPLCWRCHMMLHSRFRHPKSYAAYKEAVKNGKRYAPVYRHDFAALEEHFID